jgi:hypothetical protein
MRIKERLWNMDMSIKPKNNMKGYENTEKFIRVVMQTQMEEVFWIINNMANLGAEMISNYMLEKQGTMRRYDTIAKEMASHNVEDKTMH